MQPHLCLLVTPSKMSSYRKQWSWWRKFLFSLFYFFSFQDTSLCKSLYKSFIYQENCLCINNCNHCPSTVRFCAFLSFIGRVKIYRFSVSLLSQAKYSLSELKCIDSIFLHGSGHIHVCAFMCTENRVPQKVLV